MKTLETWIRENAEFAAKTFNETGELTAMWVAECEDGTILPICAPMTDKDRIVEAVKQIFKKHKAKRYIFMSEAWTIVERDKSKWNAAERFAERRSLSEHPDRREVIMVTGEDGERSIMGMMYILRPEHGKPTVSPFEVHSDMDRVGGRMTGLLPS